MPITFSYLLIAFAAFGLGRWSAKARWRRQPASDRKLVEGLKALQPERCQADTPSQAARLGQIIFLTGWLIAWSAAIGMVTRLILAGTAGGISLFLIGWLIAALAAWVLAASSLYRLIMGKSDPNAHHDE